MPLISIFVLPCINYRKHTVCLQTLKDVRKLHQDMTNGACYWHVSYSHLSRKRYKANGQNRGTRQPGKVSDMLKSNVLNPPSPLDIGLWRAVRLPPYTLVCWSNPEKNQRAQLTLIFCVWPDKDIKSTMSMLFVACTFFALTCPL